jgi:FAD/FMN-containing dehydrogenase
VAVEAGIASYDDAGEVDLMRGITGWFDPGNLMNPGKVLPDA